MLFVPNRPALKDEIIKWHEQNCQRHPNHKIFGVVTADEQVIAVDTKYPLLSLEYYKEAFSDTFYMCVAPWTYDDIFPSGKRIAFLRKILKDFNFYILNKKYLDWPTDEFLIEAVYEKLKIVNAAMFDTKLYGIREDYLLANNLKLETADDLDTILPGLLVEKDKYQLAWDPIS